MSTTLPMSAGPRVDVRLLDEVEEQLQSLLDSIAMVEETLPAPLEVRADLGHAWENVDRQLGGWQDRFAELSRQTSELERELIVQEQALRNWFDRMALQKELLQGRV